MALDANRKKMPIILPTTCCFPYKFLAKIVKNCGKAGTLSQPLVYIPDLK